MGLNRGSVDYDAINKSYRISGSGENMWFTSDAFQFVWKKMSGDVSLTADIRWIGTGGNPHRKACLLIRQSLDPNSPYADVAVHGEGLTSLQYRETAGAPTREIQSNVSGPQRVRIEKEGDYVFMSLAREGDTLRSAGGSFKFKLSDPFYIGLGVCAHDSNATEQAVFSNVEITSGKQKSIGEPMLESTLETVTIASTDRRVVYHSRDHFEAPNWSRDGRVLYLQPGRASVHASRSPAEHLSCSKPDLPHAAITTMAYRRTARSLLSATNRKTANHSSTYCQSPEERRVKSPPSGHLTGMAGRRTEPLWLFAANATASLIFIRFWQQVAKKND